MAARLDSGDDKDGSELHEINVTPFIDVMLVLLIIFMIASPLSTVDLPVDLPSSTAVPQKRPDKPAYVTIKADLAVALGETPVKRVLSIMPTKYEDIWTAAKGFYLYFNPADATIPLHNSLWDTLLANKHDELIIDLTKTLSAPMS